MEKILIKATINAVDGFLDASEEALNYLLFVCAEKMVDKAESELMQQDEKNPNIQGRILVTKAARGLIAAKQGIVELAEKYVKDVQLMLDHVRNIFYFD